MRHVERDAGGGGQGARASREVVAAQQLLPALWRVQRRPPAGAQLPQQRLCQPLWRSEAEYFSLTSGSWRRAVSLQLPLQRLRQTL